MGKSQTKKKTQPSRRHNPIRVPDSHLGAGAGKADKSKQEAMVPVLAKLKSPDSGDRTWACAAVTNLIQNDPGTRRMLQAKNVVGELITRLTDDVDEVVMEAAGALRNLAIDGGHELCNEMYNKSIIPALVVLVGKVSTILERIVTSQPVEGDAEINARKVVFQLSENVVSLFWCMSEASHKTLAAVNNANLVPFLVGFLSARALLPISLTLAAAQCLYSLSPDNEPLREGLLSVPTGITTVLDVLKADHTELSQAAGQRKKAKKSKKNGNSMDVVDQIEVDGRHLLVRVLAAGIIRNVALPGSKLEEEIEVGTLTREIILPMLDPLLNFDLQAISTEVSSLAAQLPSSTEVAANLAKELKTDHKTTVERQLETTEIKLSTLIVGLEIMTSICAGLEDQEKPDVEEEADAESDEDMEEEDDDETLIARGREQGDAALDGPAANGVTLTANVAQTLSYLLQSYTLPSRLSTLAVGTPLSYPPLPPNASIHPPTTALLGTIHLRSLEAVNNLYLTAAASGATNAEQLQAQLVWGRLFEAATWAVPSADVLGVKGHEIRIEVMDSVVGSLWGLAKATGGDLSVTPLQIQILQDASAVVSSDSVRVRCIETLATLAARPRISNEENLVIGSWLMSTLSSATLPGAEILVAVLNAVFDIYGDEERAYDAVFVNQGYLAMLTSIVAKVRAEARKVDRRKSPELRTRAEEAYENLAAFVKYRRNLER